MMKKLFYLSMVILLLVSCNTVKVSVNYDPQADFSTYKTFNYLPWGKQTDEMLSDYDKRRVMSMPEIS